MREVKAICHFLIVLHNNKFVPLFVALIYSNCLVYVISTTTHYFQVFYYLPKKSPP